MSQRRFVNFGADANASTVKSINTILAAPQVLRAVAPFLRADAPDQLVVRPHSVIFDGGMILDEDEQLAFTVPTTYGAIDYTLLYQHVDEDIIGGTAATIELRGGLVTELADSVVLGWVRYPGGSVPLDQSMVFPNHIGQLHPARLTKESVAATQLVISQDPNVTITQDPNVLLAQTIPGTPYEVAFGSRHVSRLLAVADQKVRVYDHTSAAELTRITAGTPATGEYILDSGTGTATFAAVDAGNVVDLSDITYGAGYRLAVNGSPTVAGVVDTLYGFGVMDEPYRAITVEYVALTSGYAVSVVEAYDVDGDAITVASVATGPGTADGTTSRLVVRLTDGALTSTAGGFVTVRLRETLPANASGLLLRVRATNYDLPF